VPLVAVTSPILCYAIDWWMYRTTGYKFGYELLMLNGALTFAGMWMMSSRYQLNKTN
ncbi:MAG TPA: sodium:solute symporter, partial [Bacteroides reticulotermitis]|nr:sodium:solute symporter [Bacteroides reticulotermitis]